MQKRTTIFSAILISLLFNLSALADIKCFIAKENDKIIENEGDCKTRYAPCSTFKIAIALMGYNEGILIDETHPQFPFKAGYVDWLDIWKQPHTPRTWIANSVVWYSQLIMQKVGAAKYQEYVQKFHYGNQDISGDKGANNTLTSSWLSSSLQISPEEQIVFLQKLLRNKLPISLKAQEMTKKILYVEDLIDGWKLYGKTGNGNQWNKEKTRKLADLQQGWFIGWIEKDNRVITFANHITDGTKHDTYASIRAKEEAKEKLLQIIQDTKK